MATKKKVTVRRISPYAPFEKEIITSIIAPKVGAIITEHQPESLKALCDLWREKWGSVSSTVMKQWLDTLGISTARRTVFVPTAPQMQLPFDDPDALLTDRPHPPLQPQHGGIIQ